MEILIYILSDRDSTGRLKHGLPETSPSSETKRGEYPLGVVSWPCFSWPRNSVAACGVSERILISF